MDLTKQGRRTILICVLLSAVTLAIFWPVTEHEFITCDDPAYLTLNGVVRQGLTWEGVQWAFANLHGATTYWHPLTWLSHMLDCQLFGLRPGWHHLVSALLHTVNVVLLSLLLQKMTSGAWRVTRKEAQAPNTTGGWDFTFHVSRFTTWGSFFVAAIFALCPLQVDSVAWASERKTLLSAFFFLLTLCAYVKYVEVRRARGEGPLQQANAERRTSDIEPVLRRPHAEFRNGAEAVRLATAGCDMTKYQNPMLLTTLAAAYGEVGQFPEAISFAERAQGLAQGDGGPLSGRLAAMLESFRANRAYHAD